MSRFAAAALSAAATTPVDPTAPELGAVLLRVGLHSGPCSAGIVGRDHPKFTLFGDTVNTAARMEQTAVAGRVQCSAATAALIRAQDPAIPLLARGRMDVKGKGVMETFWIGCEEAVEAGGGGGVAGGGCREVGGGDGGGNTVGGGGGLTGRGGIPLAPAGHLAINRCRSDLGFSSRAAI
jgi:hypothetical protein